MATLYILICVAMACVCSLSSCDFEDGRDVYEQGSDFYGTTYVGKWDVNGVVVNDAKISAGMGNVIFYDIPKDIVVRNLFPNTTIAATSYTPQPWVSLLLDSSADMAIYSLPPVTWSIRAQLDGDWHDIELTFASSADAAKPSWMSLANRTGIITVILHAKAFSDNDGYDCATDLTLTFTGKPR